MKRRVFVRNSVLAGGSVLYVPSALSTTSKPEKSNSMNTTASKFKLKYAPHFGMFKHHAGDDLMDQLTFMKEAGFNALEDNGMPKREISVQTKIGRKLEVLDMEMGVFVASATFSEVTFAGEDKRRREAVLKDIKNSIEIAKRCNAKWMTVVPGMYSTKIPWDYQTANCIELLKRCSEILEPHNLTMVLEPLNAYTNHPGLFLTKIPQAYMICEAVDSPACKILNDLYHQQITEGNLIPNIDRAWEQIAYFQMGDNPGRKEPTTGEINYRNIFKHIYKKRFTGIMGMEHGNSKQGKEGELAVIEAYRQSDNF